MLLGTQPASEGKAFTLCKLANLGLDHARLSDALRAIREVRECVSILLKQTNSSLRERIEFLIQVQHDLRRAIVETQSDPTFESAHVLDMVQLGLKAGQLSRREAVQLVRRLSKYLNKVAKERFRYTSQDPEIRERANAFRETFVNVLTFLAIHDERFRSYRHSS
jgi:hypothetical protein